jgi:Tetratricopeptide repeat
LILRSPSITLIVSFWSVSLFIGSAVNTQLEKFDDAIKDCDKAIELNPNFVKVNI